MHRFQVLVNRIGSAIIQHQPITIPIDCVEGDGPAARRRERLLVIVEGHEALPGSVLDGLRLVFECGHCVSFHAADSRPIAFAGPTGQARGLNAPDNRLTKGEHPARLASFLQGMGVEIRR